MIKEADIKFPDIPFRKTAALVVIGLAIYLGYLYLAGFQNIKEALLHADYQLIGLAMLVSLAGNLLHAAGWWVLLKEGMKYRISLFNAYLMYLSSTFFVNLIPTAAISGEVAKVYFIQKSTPDTRFDKTIAAGLMSRILEIMPTATGVVIGVVYLALYYTVPLWALVFCFVVAGVFVLIAIAALAVLLNNTLLRRMAAAGLRLIGKMLKGRDLTAAAENVDQVLKQFDESLRSLTRRPALVAASLSLIFIAWCFDMAVAYIAFLAIGYHVSALFVVTIFSVMVILQLLPTFLPGGLGLIDALMYVFYVAVGVPKEAAMGATFMVRLITLWFLTTLGGATTVYLMKAYGKNGRK